MDREESRTGGVGEGFEAETATQMEKRANSEEEVAGDFIAKRPKTMRPFLTACPITYDMLCKRNTM